MRKVDKETQKEVNLKEAKVNQEIGKANHQRCGHRRDSIRTNILEDSTLVFAKIAKEISDDKATAENGGYFSSSEGGTAISVEELDPVTYFTIDTMSVGAISKPVNFKMADGKEAVRILYFKSKAKPHQANLEQDYQKIRSAAEMEKQDRALDNWFIEGLGVRNLL